MTEAQFQSRVTDYCDLRRLRWFHSGDSRRDSCAGFPDLVICGPGGVVFLELKRESGRVKPEQQAWLDALRNAGQDALVVRPSHWEDVRALLDALAGVGVGA